MELLIEMRLIDIVTGYFARMDYVNHIQFEFLLLVLLARYSAILRSSLEALLVCSIIILQNIFGIFLIWETCTFNNSDSLLGVLLMFDCVCFVLVKICVVNYLLCKLVIFIYI